MNIKILVLSDSHRHTYNLETVLSMHNDADYIFFLGDGIGDIESVGVPGSARLISVCGNCDYGLGGEREEIVSVMRWKFLLCHGHSYMVKQSDSLYLKYAASKGVDVALFGHTHEPVNQYFSEGKPAYLFNPGSISLPERGYPSFGLINVSDKGILLSHGTV